VIRSLNTAQKSMQNLQVKIDALANNLANADSAGFRGVLTRVTTEGSNAADNSGQITASQAQTAAGGLSRPDITYALDTRQGPVRETGRATDIALMSRGYFTVATDDGERFTRNGSFVLNENKQLTTPDGHLLQGDGGPISISGDGFSVEADGSVVSGGNVVGRLKIVDFTAPQRLEHMGANLLKASADMAPQPVPPAEVTVAQGHLEGSNVSPIDTLVAMIEAQRAFEVQAKILTTQDEMLNKSVNYLPRTTG